MRIRKSFVVMLALSAAALSAAGANAWLSARRDALTAREALAATTAVDASKVLSLRGQRERASLRARPEQDLVTRVNATLSSLNLPRESSDRVTVDSDAPLGAPIGATSRGGPEFRAQAMRVSLRRLPLPDVGRFLERWRATQPLWTITSVELVRLTIADARDQRVGEPRAGDDRYDLALVLTTVYAADSARASAENAGSTP